MGSGPTRDRNVTRGEEVKGCHQPVKRRLTQKNGKRAGLFTIHFHNTTQQNPNKKGAGGKQYL